MSDMEKTNQPGFPRLLFSCSDKNYYYLVMNLLGPSLKDVREDLKDKKFSLKSVTMIAIELLRRLNSIHQCDYIHRDLKPANICISRKPSSHTNIYLIDYGLTKKEY